MLDVVVMVSGKAGKDAFPEFILNTKSGIDVIIIRSGDCANRCAARSYLGEWSPYLCEKLAANTHFVSPGYDLVIPVLKKIGFGLHEASLPDRFWHEVNPEYVFPSMDERDFGEWRYLLWSSETLSFSSEMLTEEINR